MPLPMCFTLGIRKGRSLQLVLKLCCTAFRTLVVLLFSASLFAEEAKTFKTEKPILLESEKPAAGQPVVIKKLTISRRPR